MSCCTSPGGRLCSSCYRGRSLRCFVSPAHASCSLLCSSSYIVMSSEVLLSILMLASRRPRPWSCYGAAGEGAPPHPKPRTPACAKKELGPTEKQTKRSWLHLGQGTTKPGQDGGRQRYVVGMPGRCFPLRRSHGLHYPLARSSDAACRRLCVVFAFAVHISRVRCLKKGDFECCESC